MSKEKQTDKPATPWYCGKQVAMKLVEYDSYAQAEKTYQNCYVYEQTPFGCGVLFDRQFYGHMLKSCVPLNKIIEVTANGPSQAQVDFLTANGNYTHLLHNHGSSINLGSDPEVFAVDKKGVVIPAFDYCVRKGDLAGEVRKMYSYLKPEQSTKYYEHAIPFWDGFQAEFTTAPHTCLEGLVSDVSLGLNNTTKRLLEKYPNARLVSDNLVEIPEPLLQMAAEEHVQFGCSPSMNAYGLPPLAIANGRLVPIRAAGVHLHFGIGDCPNKAELVKLLDASAGVASVALFGKEEDARRREMYGRPGEYRMPEHGLEWRVLSSAVLHHPHRLHLLVDMGRFVMRLKMAGLLEMAGFSYDEKAVQAIIMNLDIEGARAVLEKSEKFWLSFFKAGYGHTKPWEWLMKGHRKVKEIAENWTDKECLITGASASIRYAK